MSKKKQEYKPFKKHFWIPFILSLTILLAGIVMTWANQTDMGYFKGRISGRQNFVLSGPGVIVLGAFLSALLLYLKKNLK